MEHKTKLIVRGGGDLASGVIYRLYRCGYQVLILECKRPSAIRREVSFGEAVYDGTSCVEGVTGRLITKVSECQKVWENGDLPILVDESGEAVKELKPDALIDAILAKRNLGTSRNMAPITIGLGPGFNAGKDVDIVIETMRGHRLGRLIEEGPAMKNTGIPGLIKGYGKERVIHAEVEGTVHQIKKITDTVEKGDVLAYIENKEGQHPVYASMSGLLRGLIREGYYVTKGFKMADIDPRLDEYENCFTISDKARCIAGGVLEAIFYLRGQHDLS